ncbi:MAG: zinc ABC transporter substrate-binding protein [Gemmataceae bacterium]
MRATRLLALLLIGLAAVGSGCTRSERDGGCFTQSGRLRVVATHSILGDLVKNVAGDNAEVVMLVGPDADAHTFDPSPQDGITVAEAAVVFENGVGFETWLDKLYASSGSKAQRVVVTKGLKLRQGDCLHAPAERSEPHEHEDDPHVWHDVKNAIPMVEVVRDRLAEIDPPHADKYRANATAYLAKLDSLHNWVEETTRTLPPDRRKLVTNHDTFGYFADRYEFKVVGTALQSISTEASDPSAAAFAKLVDAVKGQKVPAIFAENVHNPRLMERLARDASVKLAPPLYTDALGKPGSAGDTYEKMVRHNVTAIVDALKP